MRAATPRAQKRNIRRRVSLSATAVAASVAIAIPAMVAAPIGAPNAATAKVHLTWWTWTNNPNLVIRNFEKSHPNIVVTAQNVGATNVEYAKLRAALTAGSGAPDVVQVEQQALPEIEATHKLANIARYVDKYKKDFPKWLWQQMGSHGAVYAVPEDLGPMGLIYQTGIFSKYHLTVPKTWAQYKQDAIKLHKANPNVYIARNPATAADILSLFWQAGSQLFKQQSNGSWDIAINTPTTRRVLGYWASLAKAGLTSQAKGFTVSDYHNISTARYASYVTAAWYPGILDQYVTKSAPQHFAVTLLPQWTPGGHASANDGGSANAVTSQSAHPAAAAEFAAWINTSASGVNLDAKQGTSGRGLFPASVNRGKAPAFNVPIPNFAPNANKVFSSSAADVNVGFQYSPWTNALESAIAVYGPDALSGKLSPAQALAKTQAEVVTTAQQEGYSVKVLPQMLLKP